MEVNLLNDVFNEYNADLLFSINYPVFVGEIGCNMSSTSLSNEKTWFTNSLYLLNEYGISYCAFTAPPEDETAWDLVFDSTNYTPNNAGTILISAIAGTISSISSTTTTFSF